MTTRLEAAEAGDSKPGFKAVEQNDRNSLNMEVDS
jgi:hypothetical protein